MEKLEEEIPQYKSNLQIQSQVAPLLLYLWNNGVKNEDIINMSQLVVSFQNSNFLVDVLSKGRISPITLELTIIFKVSTKMQPGFGFDSLCGISSSNSSIVVLSSFILTSNPSLLPIWGCPKITK